VLLLHVPGVSQEQGQGQVVLSGQLLGAARLQRHLLLASLGITTPPAAAVHLVQGQDQTGGAHQVVAVAAAVQAATAVQAASRLQETAGARQQVAGLQQQQQVGAGVAALVCFQVHLFGWQSWELGSWGWLLLLLWLACIGRNRAVCMMCQQQ
jgi:hypothetical protein